MKVVAEMPPRADDGQRWRALDVPPSFRVSPWCGGMDSKRKMGPVPQRCHCAALSSQRERPLHHRNPGMPPSTTTTTAAEPTIVRRLIRTHRSCTRLCLSIFSRPSTPTSSHFLPPPAHEPIDRPTSCSDNPHLPLHNSHVLLSFQHAPAAVWRRKPRPSHATPLHTALHHRFTLSTRYCGRR